MSGCRGCLGRLLLLVLLAWGIGTLAKDSGWSDATSGGLFLAALALLAMRGSGRRRASGTAQVTGRFVVLPAGRNHLKATSRWEGSHGPYPPRRGPTPPSGPRRRARDPLPARLRFQILARDGFRCRYCGRPGSTPGVVLHVDHLVPLVAGGATTGDNLLTACEECNLEKGVRAVVRAGS